MSVLKKLVGVCTLIGVLLYCFPDTREAIRKFLGKE